LHIQAEEALAVSEKLCTVTARRLYGDMSAVNRFNDPRKGCNTVETQFGLADVRSAHWEAYVLWVEGSNQGSDTVDDFADR